MELISARTPDNPFEQEVLATLAGSALAGVVTNNLLLPNVQFRNLPNEHDVVALLPGRVVTIDAKALEPGAYRDAGDGWEFRPPDGEWTPATFMGPPTDIAFKKARVLEELLRRRREDGASFRMPQVVSCIAVPDQCDVRELGFRTDGRLETGARLYLARCSDLPAVLAGDVAAYPEKRPRPDEIVEAVGIRALRPDRSSACWLSSSLRIVESLGMREQPIPRGVYRAEDVVVRRAVRVEVCPLYVPGREVRRVVRGYRSEAQALDRVRHPAVLRLHNALTTPVAVVLVYELFSEWTLQDEIESRPLPWDEACELMAPVVGALGEAHRAGIVHRYLNPSCILLSEQRPREVRLYGFFGAAVGDQSTIGAHAVDDPYGAPERGDATRGSSHMDAYSVGRCMIAAVTGHPLETPVAASLPPDVAALLHGLTATEPADRAEPWRALQRRLGVAR